MTRSKYIAIVDDRLSGNAIVWYERDRFFVRKRGPTPDWMTKLHSVKYVGTGEYIERADGALAEVYRREEDL